MSEKSKYLCAIIISLFIGLGLWVSPVIKTIQFKQNCSGYLKQSADANSIELCKIRLDKAIEYIEKNNLTSGYTSVIYETENENIGFWYSNLKACQEELATISEDATILEKTNLLMKIRESLLDDGGEYGKPSGIQFYPNNLLYGIFRIIGSVLLIIFCITSIYFIAEIY